MRYIWAFLLCLSAYLDSDASTEPLLEIKWTKEEVKKVYQTFDSSQIQKSAQDIFNQITQSAGKQILTQIEKLLTYDSIKNFIFSRVDDLKWKIMETTFRTDPYKTGSATITRYTADRPKNFQDQRLLETIFLQQRLRKASNALSLMFDTKFKEDFKDMPRIAFAFSGGGYRALTVTSGFMKALDELGRTETGHAYSLLDAALYVAGLSGSTWYIGPWIFLKKEREPYPIRPAKYQEMIIEKTRLPDPNTFNPYGKANVLSFSRTRFSDDIIFPKIVFGQPLAITDIFGGTLAHAWFGSAPFDAQTADKQQRMRLSNQWADRVATAQVPWPIYTAVSMHKANGEYRYNWYEFNPEEVRNLEYGLSVPSFAFGRKFQGGNAIGTEFTVKGVKQTFFAPEQSFGYLMGIWGSAFTINAIDLYRIYFLTPPTHPEDVATMRAAEKTMPIFEAIKKGDVSTVKDMVFNSPGSFALALMLEATRNILLKNAEDAFIRVGKLRAAPAQVLNPFYKYPDTQISSWLTDRETITFIDAGIHYNIPLRPLFVPEREIDIIIIGDASGNVMEDLDDAVPTEMGKAFADLERVYGVKYKRDASISDLTMRVFRPTNNDKAPLLIYFNFLLDTEHIDKKTLEEYKLTNFDLQACFNDYCSTYNFALTPDQFERLSNIGYLNIKTHWDTIKQVISERLTKEEDWLKLGESEENVTQKPFVPEIAIPEEEVEFPAYEAYELTPPQAQRRNGKRSGLYMSRR
jgi:hypothetical protein